jgi:hypothetical protein
LKNPYGCFALVMGCCVFWFRLKANLRHMNSTLFSYFFSIKLLLSIF